ncbi:ABC transporter substrate-binding protein [Kribbella sp. NPDC059898]|uniref:ABC transporter substrate-binding protein n=1 Tax=Kribbella sp. NPDC059898 TaxID=3346995 RepID=UPI00365074DF
MLQRAAIRTAIAGLAMALLAACGGGGGNPLDSGASGDGKAPAKVTSITVGSAKFAESELLAEMYAQALQAKGLTVKKQLNIGQREAYIAAIKDGSVDVLPEYTGAALDYFKKGAETGDADATYASLKQALPSGLELLDKSPAADEDTVVVTKATADKYHLKSIADLKPVAKDLVAGGGAEFKIRRSGLAGMKDVYGVEFKEFKTLDSGGPLSLQALKSNQIQVTNFFTTQSVIKENNLVELQDPKLILPPNNVVPLIRTDHKDSTVADALNAISAKLTTEELTDLVKRVEVGKERSEDVAKEWLTKNSLV